MDGEIHHMELLMEHTARSMRHMVMLGVLVTLLCASVVLAVVLSREIHTTDGGTTLITSGGVEISTRGSRDVLVVVDTANSRRSRALLERNLEENPGMAIESEIIAEMPCTEVTRAFADIKNGEDVEAKISHKGRDMFLLVEAHQLEVTETAFSIIGAKLAETPCSVYDVVCDKTACSDSGFCEVKVSTDVRKEGCDPSATTDNIRRRLEDRVLRNANLRAEGIEHALQGGRGLDGRRLGKGSSSPPPPPPTGPQCAQGGCSDPCPYSFTYHESCGWWFWESDVSYCSAPGAPGAAIPVGSVYSYVSACAEKPEEPQGCDAGDIDEGVNDGSCYSVLTGWSSVKTKRVRGCKNTQGYGAHKIFELWNGQQCGGYKNAGVSANFATCQWAGGSRGSQEGNTWLPYFMNSDFNCVPINPQGIGYWKDTNYGGFMKQMPPVGSQGGMLPGTRSNE